MAEGMRIGQLARETGVGVETIRYYERRGLLQQPPRRGGATRRYGTDAVRRVRFIKRAQRLGFTLREIAELLEFRFEPGASRAEVRRRAAAKLEDIERKMEDLRRMRAALKDRLRRCDGKGPIDRGCSILEALEDEPGLDARGSPEHDPITPTAKERNHGREASG